jgi:hypothetical protein
MVGKFREGGSRSQFSSKLRISGEKLRRLTAAESAKATV